MGGKCEERMRGERAAGRLWDDCRASVGEMRGVCGLGAEPIWGTSVVLVVGIWTYSVGRVLDWCGAGCGARAEQVQGGY